MRIVTFRYNKDNSIIFQNKQVGHDDSLAVANKFSTDLRNSRYTDRLLGEKEEHLCLTSPSDYAIVGTWQ